MKDHQHGIPESKDRGTTEEDDASDDDGGDGDDEDDYLAHLDEDLALLEYSKTCTFKLIGLASLTLMPGYTAEAVKSTKKAKPKAITTAPISIPTSADMAKSIIQALQLDSEGDDDDGDPLSGADDQGGGGDGDGTGTGTGFSQREGEGTGECDESGKSEGNEDDAEEDA